MKESYYNYLIEGKNGKVICYNGISNALIEIESKYVNNFKSFNIIDMDDGQRKTLFNNGFLIRDDFVMTLMK